MLLKRIGLSVALAISSSAASASAPPAAPVDFPELRPRALLIGIIKGLATTIPDPRSITDVVLCPPDRIKFAKEGERRPERWYVSFSMNARTASGGFSGQTTYVAAFRAGRVPKIVRAQMDNDEGFNHLINAATAKQIKNCPAVANEQLQALIGASDRPVIDISL